MENDVVKMVKDDATKFVSNEDLIEILKADGWSVDGEETKAPVSRGRPKKA